MRAFRKSLFFAAAFSGAVAFSGLAAAFDIENVSGAKALSSFQSVYVAPVSVALIDDERLVDADDAADRAEAFRDDIVDAFEDEFAIADAPGAGVLTIEATLVRLEASRPTMADYREQPGLAPQSVYAGGAGFTATLSEDGAVLAEIADEYRGDLERGFYPIAIWQEADRAFSFWSRELVDFVEEN